GLSRRLYRGHQFLAIDGPKNFAAIDHLQSRQPLRRGGGTGLLCLAGVHADVEFFPVQYERHQSPAGHRGGIPQRTLHNHYRRLLTMTHVRPKNLAFPALRRAAANCDGMAALEFAMLLPFMITLFFGVV